ncbi:MAG: hypothetical protein Q8936_19770, partial [Bacillota bacterium]|nr:hypothetical protein [Bacillota bacterium]
QEKDEIKKSMKQDKIGSFKFSVICRFMANEVKGKNVFFTELINNSREILGDMDLLKTIDENKKVILAKWDALINRVILNMMRIVPFDYTEEMNELVTLESNMKLLLSELHKKYKEFNFKNKYKPSSFMDYFHYENNEDDIVRVEDSKTAFHFTKDKVYDCWLGDHAPKLLLDLPNIGVREFSFSTEINITSIPKKIGFLSGIVVKTVNDSVLYYGLHSDKEIKIDEKLRNFCVEKMPYPHSSVKLQVIFTNGKCTFSYSTDGSNSMKKFYEFKPDGMICEVGLSCKSWEKSAGLSIEFKNVSFEKLI